MSTFASGAAASYRHTGMQMLRSVAIVCVVLAADSLPAGAAPSPLPTITVLDFELHDLTLTPGTAEERERTASIAPLLGQNLESQHGFGLASVGEDAQRGANRAHGYLFDHHDVVAELGREAGSDWVVVGRVHKASFLFVYLKARVIDTESHRLIADLTVEIKGSEERLTAKGVETLAAQISSAIKLE